MNPVAIIPIRSGSKGLKNKNMLYLNNKPLVAWTIDALLKSGVVNCEDIYISSDSGEYKQVLEKLYPSIKFDMRDELYASDKATTADFLVYFFNKMNFRNKNFILCQATSPLRTGQQIKEAYQQFLNNHSEIVVSVVKSDESDELFTTIDDDRLLKDIVGIDKNYRRQKKVNKYLPNGAIYISSIIGYLEKKSFFTSGTEGYLMDKTSSVDIDNKLDFEIASLILSKRENKSSLNYSILYEYKEIINKHKEIIVSDGRVENLSYFFDNQFSTRAFQGITLIDLLNLLEDNFFAPNSSVTVSAGLYDLKQYSLEHIQDTLLKIIKLCDYENIALRILKIAPVVFSKDFDNKQIDKLNLVLSKNLNSKHFKFIDVKYDEDSLLRNGVVCSISE